MKHGFKCVTIKLPHISNYLTLLKLKKQRFFCKYCSKTFIAQTDIVKRRCSISKNIYQSCILNTKEKRSIKDISKHHDISHTTLNNWIHKLKDAFVIRKDTLPQPLCFDEFKSVKSCAHKMSFICVDATTDHVIDIVQNRQLTHLKSYFFSYTLAARKRVKTICIDMYTPYISLIQSCFPHDEIICDCFYIVQLISCALNRTRITVMNENPKMRARLKRYWKPILKSNSELDCTNHHSAICFNYLMTDSQIVDELLRIDPILEAAYWHYKKLLTAFKAKNIESFESILEDIPSDISPYMKTACRTLQEHKRYIRNALQYDYSNGVIEGTNNLIKVIKRIAFGYRNYDNFRSRILLITNTMIRCIT